MRSSALEREVKLGVWPGFRLPELDGVVDGVTVGRPTVRTLEATYHDTPDLRLARSGVSLRHRKGDGTGWTLKLPDDGAAGAAASDGSMRRTEMTFAGGPKAVPPEVAGLLTAWVRTSSLVPVARLQTTRRRVELAVDGEVVGEVVDDEVSVLDGRRVAVRFREVEAEVSEAAPDGLLEELVAALRAAGAGAPDPTSKVKRALGPAASGPPDLVEEVPGPDATAADVVRAALIRSVARLLAHDAGVRLGVDPEDVHQARVATRRLRSDLRTYRDLLDPEWVAGLRDDLREVAADLGRVRDADVLLERLGRQLDALPEDDARAGGVLLERLSAQRDDARADLLARLEGPDYATLLDRLVQGARSPELLAESAAPAAEVLPALVQRPWRHLQAAADAVDPARRADAGENPRAPDEELHEVRIRAKRCRYAAEVAGLTAGRPAARFAKAVADVQEALGEHQDAVVTGVWLREAAAGADAQVALVAGQLVAVSRAEAETARAAFPAAWAAARRRKLRTWMR